MEKRHIKAFVILVIIITSILTGCSSGYPKISTQYGKVEINKVEVQSWGENSGIVIRLSHRIPEDEFEDATRNVVLCYEHNMPCRGRRVYTDIAGRKHISFEVSNEVILHNMVMSRLLLRWPDNNAILIELPK